MADNLVVDSQGQVFRKGQSGYEYVGTEKELKAKEATPSGQIGKAQRVMEAILKRGLYDVPKFFADAIYSGGNELEKAFPITPEVLKVPMMRPSEAMEEFIQTPPTSSDPLERLVTETGAGVVSGGLLGPTVNQATRFGLKGTTPTDMLVKAGAIGGGGAGAGSEVSASVFGDTPLNRVIGSILGGVAGYPGMSLATGGGAARRVNEVTKSVPNEALATAKAKMLEAQQRGIQVNVDQASPQPSPLRALQEDAARSGKGAEHTRLIGEQTPASQEAGEAMIGLYGLPRTDPTKIAEQTQKAASDAIKRAEKFPAQIAKKHFEFTVEDVPPAVLGKSLVELKKSIGKYGATTTAGRFLITEVYTPLVKGKLKNPEQIDSVMKAALAKIKAPDLATTGITDRIAGRIKEGIEGSFGKMLEGLRTNEPMGNALYSAAHKGIIDPMYRGPAGKISGKFGFDPQEGSKVDQIFKVLDDPNIRAKSIAQLQAQLDKESPQAFARYTKAAMERKLELAFKGSAGTTPLDAPGKFTQALWGGPDQRVAKENFRAAMAATAKSLGKNPAQSAEFVRGMEKMLSAIETAGRGKVIASPEMGKSKVVETAVDVARGTVYTPQAPSASGRAIQNLFGAERARQKIFDMIWTPEGVDEIRRYARMSIPDIRTAFTASAALETASQATRGH